MDEHTKLQAVKSKIRPDPKSFEFSSRSLWPWYRPISHTPGKAPSTQAGEYVREEMHKTKKGTKEVQSRKQAVAIGHSKARRDGVNVPRKKRAA